MKNDRINSMSDSLTIRDEKIRALQDRITALELAATDYMMLVKHGSLEKLIKAEERLAALLARDTTT